MATLLRSSLLCVLLCAPAFADAQVVISEIMYDLAEGSDAGREWIEVYNSGVDAVPLTNWTVLEQGKKHGIKAVQGGATLAPHGFAVIADNAEKFLSDHPSYTGLLFDSAFALNNKGESVALLDAHGNTSDTVTYTSALGGNGTGESLQEIAAGSFAPGVPTPGAPVPSAGLVSVPRKESKEKQPARSAPANMLSERNTLSIVGTPPPVEVVPMHLTSAAATPSRALPLAGVVLIASVSIWGVLYAAHLRKDEWTIIDETPEAV